MFGGATAHNITGVGTLAGPTNSRLADNIVSCTGTAANLEVAVFSGTSGKLVTSSATTLASYLPLSGGTMSGDIALGGHELTGAAAIRPSATNVLIGASATNVNTNNVVIGQSASTTSAAAGCVVEGKGATTNNVNCVVVGNTASSTNQLTVVLGAGASQSGSGSVTIGQNVAGSGGSSVSILGTASNTTAVAVGSGSTASGGNSVALGTSAAATATGAVCIGSSITNGTADSVMLGSVTVVNVRPGGDNVCDLGTSSLRYKNAYVVGVVGTTGATNAAAGNYGEYTESALPSGSAVTFSTGASANVTSISLTPGDYDCDGVIVFQANPSTLTQLIWASVSSVSATNPSDGSGQQAFGIQTVAGNNSILNTGLKRFSLSATTTIYLIGTPAFTVSSLKGYGTLRARRIR